MTAIYSTAILLMLQVTEPFGAIGQIERLGLTGALLAAVGILWKSNAVERAAAKAEISKKDDQVLEMARQVAAALASNSDTQRELRTIVQASAEAKQHLAVAIDGLTNSVSALPCTGTPRIRKAADQE
jgi:hypothetical protein